jgi:hypothetical protein
MMVITEYGKLCENEANVKISKKIYIERGCIAK